MNSDGPPQAARTSGLAIASLVLGILGCLMLPAPIAIVLGIIALVKMGKDPQLKGRGLAIAGVVLGTLGFVFAVLAAMAIPSFMTFGARSKQAECKSNLKSIFTAQRAHYADYDKYAEDFKTMGFVPERRNRYAYVMSVEPRFARVEDLAPIHTGILQDPELSKIPEQTLLREAAKPRAGGVLPGLFGDCPADCHFAVVCIGQNDTDDFVDIWSVSTKPRTGPDGESIAAGEIFHEQDDTQN